MMGVQVEEPSKKICRGCGKWTSYVQMVADRPYCPGNCYAQALDIERKLLPPWCDYCEEKPRLAGWQAWSEDPDARVYCCHKCMESYSGAESFEPILWRTFHGQKLCCSSAQWRSCVCECSFTCAEHGDKCIGSHD